MMDRAYPTNPYPVHALNKAVRDAVWEVQRKLQAPDALIASCFLTAMSVACQPHIDVELPTGQRRPCILYLITIADSGERKTTTDNLVCAPIYEHDAKQKEAFANALATYEADLHSWEAVNAAIQRKISKCVLGGESVDQFRHELIAHTKTRPIKPLQDRIIFEDITKRPFMEALRGDGASFAILSDEGEIVLRGGAMNNLGMLNKAWDGAKRLTFDRADESIEVTNPRVTISFMVQTDVFQEFMGKRGSNVRASGHLARYLVGKPVSTQGFRFMTLDEASWQHLPAFHARVRELLDEVCTRRAAGDHSRKLLTFSPEAKEAWARQYNYVEERLKPGGPLAGMRDFASKSMELVSRVAAIFHHFSRQEGDVVSQETLQRAMDVVGWHFDEFARLFGDRAYIPEYQKDAAVLWRYLCEMCTRIGGCTVARNDVRKNGPIRDQARFEAALNELQRCGSIAILIQGRKRYINVAFQQPIPVVCQPPWPQPPWTPVCANCTAAV